jgi:hypothetical protein
MLENYSMIFYVLSSVAVFSEVLALPHKYPKHQAVPSPKMSPHLHTCKRVSPAQSPGGVWMMSPPKRMLTSHQQKKVAIMVLPE